MSIIKGLFKKNTLLDWAHKFHSMIGCMVSIKVSLGDHTMPFFQCNWSQRTNTELALFICGFGTVVRRWKAVKFHLKQSPASVWDIICLLCLCYVTLMSMMNWGNLCIGFTISPNRFSRSTLFLDMFCKNKKENFQPLVNKDNVKHINHLSPSEHREHG